MTASTWQPATSLLVSDRQPTAAERETIAAVHELVRDWQFGLPIDQVRQLCSARDRWTATRFTQTVDRRFAPLMAMLDALIATDQSSEYGHHYQTPQGTFSEAEFRDAGARMIREPDGRLRFLFPALWPWRRKPDPETGDPGERGEPIYGETADDRHRILSIKQAVRRATKGVLD